MFRNLVLASVFVTCSACSDTTSTTSESIPANVKSQESSMNELTQISGQLLYQKMEGGFLGFIADDGRKYTLRGLDKQYRKNGMRLTVTAMPIDIMTITQFGQVMQVQEVLNADDSAVKPTGNLL